MSLKRAFFLILCALSILMTIVLSLMGFSFVKETFRAREELGRFVANRVYADLVDQTSRVQRRLPLLIKDPEMAPGENVRLLALLDGDRYAFVYRGDLPVGAPVENLGLLWESRRFFGTEDHFLLVRRYPYRGQSYIIGIFPDFRGALPRNIAREGFGLVICDPGGRTLWQEGPNPFADRGYVPQEFLSSVPGWYKTPWGRWIRGRAFPLPLAGLKLFISYPLSRLLPAILEALAFPGLLAGIILFLVCGLWLYLRHRVLDPVERAGKVAAQVGRRLEAPEESDTAGEMMELGDSLAALARGSSVSELRDFGRSFSHSLETLAARDEEIRDYSHRLEEMNRRLDETNREVIERDRTWRRVFEMSQAIARDGAGEGLLEHVCEILMYSSGACRVALGVLEGNPTMSLFFSSLCGRSFPAFSVPFEGSLIGRAIRQRVPVWYDSEEKDPHYHALGPEIRSEVNIPLFHMGRTVGGLTLGWDREYAEDPVLLETILPLAAYIAGILDAEQAQKELKDSYHYLVNRFQHVTAIYHDETAGHLARTEAYCRFLARKLGRSPEEVEDIGFFSRVHDIGKLKVPLEILAKEGPLTQEEFLQIQKHTLWGAEILGDADWLAMGRRICLAHHEKWDGSGYPRGLCREAIPWEARIMALADIYDALRSRRCYKPARSHEDVVRVILEGDGRVMPGHFDPRVLQIFRREHLEMARVYDRYAESTPQAVQP